MKIYASNCSPHTRLYDSLVCTLQQNETRKYIAPDPSCVGSLTIYLYSTYRNTFWLHTVMAGNLMVLLQLILMLTVTGRFRKCTILPTIWLMKSPIPPHTISTQIILKIVTRTFYFQNVNLRSTVNLYVSKLYLNK